MARYSSAVAIPAPSPAPLPLSTPHKTETLAEDTEYERLSFAGSAKLQAVKIPINSIYVNSPENKYMVVWINKETSRAF